MWVVPLHEDIIDSFNLKVEPLIAESNLSLGSQRKWIYIKSQSNFTRGTKRYARIMLQSPIVYTSDSNSLVHRSGFANPDRAGRARAVSVRNPNCRLLDSSMYYGGYSASVRLDFNAARVVEQHGEIITRDLLATALQGEHLFHQVVNRVVQDLHRVPNSVIP